MANGNFGGGDGSKSNPFLIEDADDLNAVRNIFNKHYKLVNDIDLGVPPYNTGEGWVPIGVDGSNPFIGVFYGDGYTIQNLYINRPNGDHQGLFGYIHTSKIYNTKVIVSNIIGNDKVGSLIGLSSDSIITNCCSIANTIGHYDTGGLIGAIYNGSRINTSYSTGNVIGGTYAGGLVSTNNSSTIDQCYSSTSVKGNSNIGGLIGHSYNAQTSNSYWDMETSGQNTSEGGTGKTTAEMKIASTFIGWDEVKLPDSTKIWNLQDGQYPKLWYEINIYFLIQQNNNTYSIKSDYFQNIEIQTLSKDLFEKYGTKDINDLCISRNTNYIQQDVSLDVGTGKMFEIQLSDDIKSVNNIQIE